MAWHLLKHVTTSDVPPYAQTRMSAVSKHGHVAIWPTIPRHHELQRHCHEDRSEVG